MRLTMRDLIGTLLVAAIAVPYIGYLVRGEMPFVQDPRGMASLGLVLGTAAFLVLRTGDGFDRLSEAEIAVAGVSALLGIAAIIFAEAAVAELLLALFMGSIALVWLMELADHEGVLPSHHPTGAAS